MSDHSAATAVDSTRPPSEDWNGARGSRGARLWAAVWPVFSMAVIAALLGWLLLASRQHDISFGQFTHPPVYGVWVPAFGPAALVVVPALAVLCGVGVLVTSLRRVPTWLALVLLIAAGVATGAAVALSRGNADGVVQRLTTGFGTYYTADMHFVEELGIRGFDQLHPHLSVTKQFAAYNVRTHPPGMVVLLYLIYRALGAAHVLPIALVLAVLSMAAAVPAWMIGRELYGDRAGRVAALLFVAAPGPLILAFTSVDAIYATVMTTAAALFVVAIARRSPAFAVAGGAVLGVGAYLTYAVVFIGLAVAVATIVQVRTPRVVASLLGGAALGGVAVLALERFALGFDTLRSYAAIPSAERSYDPYWIVGHPGALLILAGLPLACFGVVGLVRKAPDGRFSLLPVTLVALMLIWGALPSAVTHLRPGEVERTWAFLYPVLAACAGPMVDRWTRARRRPWLWLVLLVIISVAQATVVKLLWVTVA